MSVAEQAVPVCPTGINYAAYTTSLKWIEVRLVACQSRSASQAVRSMKWSMQVSRFRSCLQGPGAVPQTSSLASVAAAAACAGFVLSFVLSPAELVKVRRSR